MIHQSKRAENESLSEMNLIIRLVFETFYRGHHTDDHGVTLGFGFKSVTLSQGLGTDGKVSHSNVVQP